MRRETTHREPTIRKGRIDNTVELEWDNQIYVFDRDAARDLINQIERVIND